jgi:membrane protease YdiL (CAAX protease family)
VKPGDALGFRGPQLKRALLMAVIVFIIILPTAWLLQWASVTTLTKLGWPPDHQLAVQLFENADSWWMRAYLGVFAACLAPVGEEFIFRGVLYPFVKQLGWPRLALFSVSFLFALIHFDVATFLPLFMLALALTWLYEKTDNLLAPILVHALFNGSNLIMLELMHLNILPDSQ